MISTPMYPLFTEHICIINGRMIEDQSLLFCLKLYLRVQEGYLTTQLKEHNGWL